MKIVQITDLHLVPGKQDMHGVNPYERLSKCVEDIQQNHSDAELCVISGDLAHKGEVGAYEDLSEILTRLPMPYRLMVGNHDHRDNLRSVFPETAEDPNGFIQSSVDLDAGRLILIDSAEKGEKYGTFCQERATWLTDQLEGCDGRPAYLFLHHPPFEIGIPYMDGMRMLHGADLLADTIAPFTNIRHMFLGHVHRPIAGSWRGLPFSIFRGTAHQVALRLEETEYLVRSHEPPAYGVILLNTDSVIVHYHDYLDNTAFVAEADIARRQKQL
ncbi:MAG: phosphodiesterase [Rhodospirillaceae bacterium]|nr:phosphodiesterase [Rhodospirillaceae bacterium]MBT6136655.1 phosphodiesterase [Rhodospirillaceae bacterium]